MAGGLAVAATTAALVVFGSGPAAACSCTGRTGSQASTDRAQARNATAVFVGTLVHRVVPDRPGPLGSTGDPAVFTFEVSRVFKGAVTANQRLLSARDGSSCGLELRTPGPFLVFARDDKQPAPDYLPAADRSLPWAGLCAGTREVAAEEKLALGNGRPPLAATAAPSPTDYRTTDDALATASTAEKDEDSSGTYALLVAAAAVLAGAAAVWRLRHRERAP